MSGLYRDTGNKCLTYFMDGCGRAPWITRQKHLKGAVNGLYEDTGKNWPTAVVDGLSLIHI